MKIKDLRIVSCNKWKLLSIAWSSMVSIAGVNPGDPGSSPGWFAAWNSNWKLSVQACGTHPSKYCNPDLGDTLVGGDKWPPKDALATINFSLNE